MLSLLSFNLLVVAATASSSFFPGPRSPLVVPNVRNQANVQRKLSDSVDRCALEDCGFDGTAYEHVAILKSSASSSDPEIKLYWTLDGTQMVADIAVEATNVRGWFALGISTSGGMMGSDIWRLSEPTTEGTFQLTDMFVEDWTTPREDQRQNLKLLSAKRSSSNKLSFSFQRMMHTCDGGASSVQDNMDAGTQFEDMDILPGVSQSLIYAWSNGETFSYHGREKRGYVNGFSWGTFSRSIGGALVDEEGRPEADGGDDDDDGANQIWDDQFVMEYLNEPFSIDHDLDTILVHTHFIPPPGGSWVITNIEQISDSSVSRFHHHMLFYGCTETPTVNNVSVEERNEAYCNEILAVSPGFGLAVGGASSILGFRVEVHYDGLTSLTQNQMDPGAGYRVTYVPNDGRVEEMGVLITGSIALQIPGDTPRNDEANHFWGICDIPDSIPEDGVNVMYNFWHMHLRGRGMYTQHIRNGVELEPLGRNNYYDWWYQGTGGVAPVGRKLLPGDRLIIHCYFDTQNRETLHPRGSDSISGSDDITFFGEGTNDEMCFDFIAYYPRHNDLKNCFNIMGQGPVEDYFDRRRLGSSSQEDTHRHVAKTASPWVKSIIESSARVPALSFASLPPSSSSVLAKTLSNRRRETSTCDGTDPGCFETGHSCFSTLEGLCAPYEGSEAYRCFGEPSLCHAPSGRPASLAFHILGGACIPAFAFCGPCFPHSPCGGRFQFDLYSVDSFVPYSAPLRGCDEENAFLSTDSSGGDQTVAIAGAVAAIVVVGVLAVVIYVNFFKSPGGRPMTPPCKVSPKAVEMKTSVVTAEVVEDSSRWK